MSAFVDEVTVYATAGDGGDGAVAWRREAYVPRGGPAGGDGGNGGNVVLIADESMRSLLDFKFRRHLRAKNGEPGKGKGMFGAKGDDCVVKVPVGTQVLEEHSSRILFDLTEDGQEAVICEGGSGGHGNARFATSTRRAPDFSKPGLPGEEKTLRLSLKLLADVGLLGFPNAGKSTFLATVSAARPKIADYPFTTLIPQLGVVEAEGGRHFVMADIPGLVEGASEGVGLGIRFLKHLERVRVIAHLVETPLVVDGALLPEQTPLERYRTLRDELISFNPNLAAVREVVVLTKCDLLTDEAKPAVDEFIDAMRAENTEVLRMSAAASEGVSDVVSALAKIALTPVSKKAQEKANQPFDPLNK